ncbi:MAG: peptidoglycan-binding domain-containing protein [Inquilinaceae bacterium]
MIATLRFALLAIAVALGGLAAGPATAQTQPNACTFSFNGVCDHPGIGTGACAMGTDTADCAAVSGIPDADTNVVYQIQTILKRHGYDPGPVDGIAGPRTRSAIRRFQTDYNSPVTGQPTPDLLTQLRSLQ